MKRKFGWLLAGAIVGVVAVGPWQSSSEAGTGPATIRINRTSSATSSGGIVVFGSSCSLSLSAEPSSASSRQKLSWRSLGTHSTRKPGNEAPAATGR